MSRPTFALLSVLFVVVVFLGMWLAWRARARRDSGVTTSATAPVGELIAEFSRVFYVSTTPVGEPLVRVAVRGLSYRGRSEVAVRHDGVTIAVDGEQPVHLAADQLIGGGSAGRRIGKAVENGGLALIVWRAPDGDTERELESSFRFDSPEQQASFIAAIDQISASSPVTAPAPQEDAK